jgi:hypothetical protein
MTSDAVVLTRASENSINVLRRTIISFLAVFLFAAATGTAETGASPTSAHDLVNESIQVMGHKFDLRQLRSVQMTTNTLVRKITYTGEPYGVSIAAATVTDDLMSGARLSESSTGGANGEPAVVTRELILGEADQAEVNKGGKVERSARLSSPVWEMGDPFRVLGLADRANDLRRESDISFHDSPHHVVSFLFRSFRVRLYIDARNKLPTATDSIIAYRNATDTDVEWNGLGDVRERTEFMLWDIVDGMRYPTQWDTYRNDVLLQTVVVSGVHTNVSVPPEKMALSPDTVGEIARIKSTGINDIALGEPIADGLNPKRPIEEIAPGIVQIPAPWYTTLVRQDDGIVIIDAPVSSGYSKHVIEESERRFPGVPIKAVITSTGYLWHIAGVREYAARHIPIYMRDTNRSTVERILNSPHTLVPDNLSMHPVKPIIRSVSDRTVIGHGKNAVVVIPIWLGFEPMVMTYIPDAHILHTGAMVQPSGPNGAPGSPESLLEIRDTVLYEKLSVDRIIGIHMSPTPWSALEAAIREGGA